MWGFGRTQTLTAIRWQGGTRKVDLTPSSGMFRRLLMLSFTYRTSQAQPMRKSKIADIFPETSISLNSGKFLSSYNGSYYNLKFKVYSFIEMRDLGTP